MSVLNCFACSVEMSADDVVFPEDFPVDSHCFDCVTECDYCGTYWNDIYDHRQYECDDCGRSFCPETGYSYCHNCGTYHCERCGDCSYCQRACLRGYHDNPTLIFYGSGDFHMGVELEYHGDSMDIVGALHNTDDSERHFWACDDGSLHGGAEIISHPMTLAYIRTVDVGRMLRDIERADSYIDDGSGLHVHINRKAFRRPDGRHSQLWAARWLKFILSNRGSCEIIGRRESDEWAQFVRPGGTGNNGRSAPLMEKSAEYRTCDNRYTAVNTTKSATYELRFFMSTYSYADFMTAVEFAHASVNYARYGMTDIPPAVALSWSAFAAWVGTRTADYPHLADALQCCEGAAPYGGRY